MDFCYLTDSLLLGNKPLTAAAKDILVLQKHRGRQLSVCRMVTRSFCYCYCPPLCKTLLVFHSKRKNNPETMTIHSWDHPGQATVAIIDMNCNISSLLSGGPIRSVSCNSIGSLHLCACLFSESFVPRTTR